MDFNNTTDKNGLIQTCEMNLFGDSPFGKISNDASRLTIFTNLINEAYSRYAIVALTADNSWQFDDSTFTDYPIGTTTLTAGQAMYTFNTDQVEIESVEILDSTGLVWKNLPEIDEREFPNYNQSLSQYYSGVSGQPSKHLKIANGFQLFPAPSYTVAGGIKVRFKRAPNYFASTDTTRKPGINRMHQTYLTDYATWKYAFSRDMKVANKFQELVLRWEEKNIPEFYATRTSGRSTTIRSKYKRSPR
jgi:hypothetical protein